MSKVLVTESSLAGIAAAIRAKNGSSDAYKPGQMAAAIQGIPTGITPTGTVNITQNGTVDVTDYASADVAVPNSYAAADEGKVVSNGALVAQTARASEITANGTYDTTTNDEVTVNVSGGGGSGNILSGADMPSAAIGSNGDIYLRYAHAGLKNSAGQYINTGYHGNSSSKYVMLLKLDTAQTSRYPTPFGARSALNAVQNAAYWSTGNDRNYNASNIGWGSVQTDLNYGAASMIGKVTEISLEAGRMDVTIDGVKQTHTFTATAISDTTPVGIYTMLIGGSVPSFGVGMDDMILYAFDIYESNVLVHSYRPALDGNDVACIYDSVSDEYLYHSGGGTLQYIEDGTIIEVLLKVNGAWQDLAGSDIDDVDTSGGSGGDPFAGLTAYIESSGTQYINTGYTIAANTRFEVVANVPDNSSAYPALFGERTSTSNEVVLFVEFGGGNIGMIWANGDGSFAPNFWDRGYIGKKCEYVLGAAGEVGIRDADNYGFKGTRNTGTGGSLPVYLFVLNENNSPNSVTYCVAKLYRFRVYEGDTLVMELLPFVDGNNVACLKDSVSENLFYNAGSGSFTYGTDA